MHSVIQAAPGVWQFLTKSRATPETGSPVSRGGSDSSSGSLHDDGSGHPRGRRRVVGRGIGVPTV